MYNLYVPLKVDVALAKIHLWINSYPIGVDGFIKMLMWLGLHYKF